MGRTRRLLGGAAAAALVLGCLTAAAASNLPTPGTAAEIAKLVKAAPQINVLPSDLVPPIQDVAYDNAAKYFPATKNGCTGTTQCVYGDADGTGDVAVFGDSHAAMWLPALNWIGKQLDFHVVLLWMPGCPAADVTVWNASSHSPNVQCNEYRTSSLKAIIKLDPELVLISDRTNDIRGPDDKLISNATWEAGEKETLSDLIAAGLKVAVIGDVTAMTNMIPQCLAQYPEHIQRCSSPNPNPAMHQHVAAEMAAAKAEDAPYLNPQKWICSKTCSPVVGDLDVYYDSEHVSATYAEYLSKVLEADLKPLLPPTS